MQTDEQAELRTRELDAARTLGYTLIGNGWVRDAIGSRIPLTELYESDSEFNRLMGTVNGRVTNHFPNYNN